MQNWGRHTNFQGPLAALKIMYLKYLAESVSVVMSYFPKATGLLIPAGGKLLRRSSKQGL